MSPIQEILDRVIAEKAPDGPMIKQLRNQIMADKRNQSTQQMCSGGMTADHTPKADTRFMASQSMGVMTDD